MRYPYKNDGKLINLIGRISKNKHILTSINSWQCAGKDENAVKRLLKKYGYPPDKQEKAVEIVMEQTKLMCENEVN